MTVLEDLISLPDGYSYVINPAGYFLVDPSGAFIIVNLYGTIIGGIGGITLSNAFFAHKKHHQSVEIQSKIQKQLFEDIVSNPEVANKYNRISKDLAFLSLQRHTNEGSPKLVKRVK